MQNKVKRMVIDSDQEEDNIFESQKLQGENRVKSNQLIQQNDKFIANQNQNYGVKIQQYQQMNELNKQFKEKNFMEEEKIKMEYLQQQINDPINYYMKKEENQVEQKAEGLEDNQFDDDSDFDIEKILQEEESKKKNQEQDKKYRILENQSQQVYKSLMEEEQIQEELQDNNIIQDVERNNYEIHQDGENFLVQQDNLNQSQNLNDLDQQNNFQLSQYFQNENQDENVNEQDQNDQLDFKIIFNIQKQWQDREKEVGISLNSIYNYQNIGDLKKDILRSLRVPRKYFNDLKFTIQNILRDISSKQQQKRVQVFEQDTNHKEKKRGLKKVKQNNHILFTEQGEIIQQSSKKFELNKPNDQLYLGNKQINCCFCQESSNDPEFIKKLGPIYGPYNYKKKSYYTHLMCAIWTPQIYLDKDNRMKNVKAEISRCNSQMCNYCGDLGGGLGCKIDKCKYSYHYKCAIQSDSECKLDQKNFTLYCKNHQKQYLEEVVDSDENEENGKDQDCENDNQNQNLQNNNNLMLNIDEIYCEICNSLNDTPEQEAQLILCDICDKGYHIFCLNPPLQKVPEGDWYCPECFGD
ncbi:Zinc finger, FYVE/PHD-type [Pseudocohnilembus persalinus]|uniref:Zinc finger, FYVE/PHD-type n=1 Tax=Pseudocohnilembus persalinus TaxID=266149 RepID=A0A0V0Q9U3_PSEPJ|nr:Zinc finger, FYVE/PHD-type [Pseudocohnilembus persalinus]|eukprot:KRW98990.1 Zinc finger, FYVE/PHD-type [Pseudocohnilembus persalinus]